MSAPEGAAGPAAQPPSGDPAAGGPPSQRQRGARAAARRVVGAFTRRGYPEDRHTRQKVTLGALLSTTLAIVGLQARSSAQQNTALLALQAQQVSTANMRTVEARQDYRDAITAIERVATKIEANTDEMRKTRTELLQKIPNVAPRARELRAAPAASPWEPARPVRPAPVPEPHR